MLLPQIRFVGVFASRSCMKTHTPVLPALRALESPATREWMRHSLDSLARREGISWIDLEADARFHPDDFADMDHLGPQGAWRFTSVLDSLMRTSPARR